MRFLRRLATWPIRFYQRFISPLKPPMCRFSPTCSQYAVETVEAHGILRGGAYAVWRILRCHPFCRGGHDPVPPSRTRP
ncbi:MAG: membrane protein insertion efficiency factor YidD [Planctomycetota bacterium]